MQFKGQLLLPDEPGPGLRVNLDVAEHHLAVQSDDGGLGAWPLETVDVIRLQGDVFGLTVAGESLHFVADDTIAFAYSGLPVIESVSRRPLARSTFRTMFDRIWNGPEDHDRSAPVNPVSFKNTDGAGPVARVEDGDADGEPIEEERLSLTERIDQAFAELEMATEEAVVELGDVDRDDPELNGSDPVDQAVEIFGFAEKPASDLPEVADGAPDQPTRFGFPATLAEVRGAPEGEDMAEGAQCPAIRSDGRRCESPILTSSGYCYPHDPKRAFEDRYQAALEARAQLKRDATERLNRIYNRLDKAMRQIERGELDPETAAAMAQIATTMCAILNMEASGES